MRSRLFPLLPFQPSLSLDRPQLMSLTPLERTEALALLATLLLEASGAVASEGDDEHP